MLNPLKLKKTTGFLGGVIVVMMVVGVSLPVIKSGLYVLDAFQHKRNFSAVRKTFHKYRPLLAASMVIPPGSSVQIFPASELDIDYISARYFLYPSFVSESGDYVLDFTGTLGKPDAGSTVYSLSSGEVIYAKPGKVFLNGIGRGEDQYSLWKTIGVFCLVSFFNIAIWAIVLRCFLGWGRNSSLSWYIATSYSLGFLIVTAAILFFLLAGGKLGAGPVLGILGTVALLLRITLREKGNSYSFYNRDDTSSDLTERTFKVFAIFLSIFVLLTGVLTPAVGWDALSHWLLKSKIFFCQQTLDLSHTHTNYYPVFWSLNIAAQYALTGGVYDELAQWTAATFFIILLCQLRRALSCLNVSGRNIWLAMLFFLGVSNAFNSLMDFGGVFSISMFSSGIPENALLAYLTGAILFILAWLKDPSQMRLLVFAIVSALGMTMVKLEGSVMAVFLGTSLFLLLGKRRNWPKSAWMLILCFFGILIFPLMWMLWVKTHGYFQVFYHSQAPVTGEKIRLIGQFIFQVGEILNICCIYAFSVLFLFFIRRNKAWSDQEFFLACLTVFLAVFPFVAILGWPIETMTSDGPDAIRRLFCHAVPSLTLLLASRMS